MQISCFCDFCNFYVLTRQSQKKSVSPNTEKVHIKPLKNASFVDLSPAPPVFCCRRYSCRGPSAKMFAGLGSKGFESKGCFDIEGEIQPKI